MENEATAVLQVILNKLNKLEAVVLTQAATIDAFTSLVGDVTERLEEAVDRAIAQGQGLIHDPEE